MLIAHNRKNRIPGWLEISKKILKADMATNAEIIVKIYEIKQLYIKTNLISRSILLILSFMYINTHVKIVK